MDTLKIVEVTPENILEETLFCIKDPGNPGFENKRTWFEQRYAEGLRIMILKDNNQKPIAFIEYVPAACAWRPVTADGYLFIHCLFVYLNRDKNRGYASRLLDHCEKEAKTQNLHGVVTMTSNGSWMADRRLFEKNGFAETDRRGRFELMVKKLDPEAPDPRLIDWTLQQKAYKGWHLHYADQCPWHGKSVLTIQQTAQEYGIPLQVKKITTAQEAKNAPSGSGVFSLLRDGKLLADHYISQTRFKNILQKEMKM